MYLSNKLLADLHGDSSRSQCMNNAEKYDQHEQVM